MTYKVIRVLEYFCNDLDKLQDHMSRRGVKRAAATAPIAGDGIVIIETTITPVFEVKEQINVPENQAHDPA